MENVSLNRLRQKLTSQSGASITYALLLFLVCAVVSSVVLAAGTAASGRMSKSVENDERYYSVTSAAEFLKKQIDGKTVTLKTVTVQPEGGEETTTSTWNAPNDFLKMITEEVLGSKADKTFTINASVGDSSASEVTVKAQFKGKTAPAGGEEEDPPIDSSMDAYGGADFGMTMNVYNTPPSGEDEKGNSYKLTLIFTADMEKQTRKEGVSTKTITTIQRVTWNYYSISTVDYSVT